MAKSAKKKDKTSPGSTIALNKKARHEYALEDRFEAGLALEGWEVKSLRAGKAQLVDSYVLVRNGEAWLLGANFSPLASASTHVIADPQRTRKLLLNHRELVRIMTATQQKGYACVATRLYWKGSRAKCEIALGRGKKLHDKRAALKDREWGREKERLRKHAQ